MGNALWANWRKGAISADEALAAMRAIRARPPVELRPLDDLIEPALAIALSLPHPIYDCFYLALAQAERCQLVTADQRLIGVVENTAYQPLVRPLS